MPLAGIGTLLEHAGARRERIFAQPLAWQACFLRGPTPENLQGLCRSSHDQFAATEVQATSDGSRCSVLRPGTQSFRCCPVRSVSAV
jgi:hypothetical protein